MSALAESDIERNLDWLQDEFPELQKDTRDLVAALKAGLPTDRVEKLKDLLDVSTSRVTELLGIPSSTLARRRQSGLLDRDESERTYRLAHLLHRAAEVFGTIERAREWLKKPQLALGGSAPLAFADTEPGAREVDDLLIRIEHGISI